MATDPSSDLLPIRQAAEFLHVSVDTVRRWEKEGTLKAQRSNGGHRLFSRQQLENFKNKRPLKISEVAALLGVSTSTLRRHEKRGLITPQIDDKGRRLYSRQAIDLYKKAADQGFDQVETTVPQSGVEEAIAKPSTTPVAEPKPAPKPQPKTPALINAPTERISDDLPTYRSSLPLPSFNIAKQHPNAVGIALIVLAFIIGLTPFLFFPSAPDTTDPWTNLAQVHSTKQQAVSPEVLGLTKDQVDRYFEVNVPAFFSDGLYTSRATISDTLIIEGSVEALGVDVDLGEGVISAANLNNLVNTVQGETGDVNLEAGEGIAIEGLTISNTAQGIEQNTFQNIEVGSTSASADTTDDTFTVAAGDNVTLTLDAASDKLTIAADDSIAPGHAFTGNVTGTLSTSDSTALTIACTDCLNATEIEDIYVLNTGDTIAGDFSPGTDSTYDLGTASLGWKEIYGDTVNATEVVATGATVFNGVRYYWPSSDGSSLQVLSTSGAGTLSWTSVGAGIGDVTAVGDCASSDCFDGTSGTQLVFNDSDGDGTLQIADLTAARAWTLPDLSGTFILSGHTFTSDVTGTLDTDGSTALTIANNAVTLGTQTTGNYVATIADAGNSTVTVANSGSETAAVTLDVIDVNCTDCLNATEIEDIYVLNTGDSVAGNLLPGSDSSYDLGASGTAWREIYVDTVNSTELVNTGSATLRGVKYLFPSADGSNNYVLSTDGSGNLAWSSASGIGAVDGSGTANYLSKWSDSDTLTSSILQDDGLVLLAGGDLEPETDSTYELGSSALRWDSLYVGSINAEGHILPSTTSTYDIGASGTVWREVYADTVNTGELVATGSTTLRGVKYLWPGADGSSSQALTTDGAGNLSWVSVAAGLSGSGTANYIAKWTAADTLANSLIQDNSLVVTVGGDLEPGTDSTYELGSSALRWDALYVGSVNAEGNIVAASDSSYNIGSDTVRWLNVFADSVEATAIASGTVTPLADSSYDLGTSALKWANVYADTIDLDFTEGSILFIDDDGQITQDNSNLFYNNNDNYLGIGTTTPSAALNIDSENTSTHALLIEHAGDGTNISNAALRVTAESGAGAAYFYSNVGAGMDDSLVEIHQDHASGDRTALEIDQDGTGTGLDVDVDGSGTGISVGNQSTTNPVLDVDSILISDSDMTGAVVDIDTSWTNNNSSADLIAGNVVSSVTSGSISYSGSLLALDFYGNQAIAGDLTWSGKGLEITSNCAGTCTDSATMVHITQSHADNTGDAIYIDQDSTSTAEGIVIDQESTGLALNIDYNTDNDIIDILAESTSFSNDVLVLQSNEEDTGSFNFFKLISDADGTPDTELTINQDGDITTDGNLTAGFIYPNADSTYELGSSALRWDALYVGSIDAEGNIIATTDSTYDLGSSSLYWANAYIDTVFSSALNVGTTSETYPFEVTNGTDQLYVDMNDNALVWTDGTNSFDFDTDGGPTYSGTARPTRQVTLSPEFEGGSLTADGANNTGTMTTDFCEQGAHADIPDTNTGVCNTSGDIHNYYSWTTSEGTAQDYDIWIRYRVPDNFAAWASDPIDVYGKRTDATNNAVTVYVFDTTGALENSGGTQVAGTTWASTTIEASFAGTYTAGAYMTMQIHVVADTGGDSVQVGEINLDYLTSN